MNEVEIQQNYYTRTAESYDEMHLKHDWEHVLALHILAGFIEFYQIESVLDIGAGTGRALLWLRDRFPDLKLIGIEPVDALREKGYEKGLSPEELVEGDAYQIPFPDNSFDLVCEFAVLHHVREPNKVVKEMSRVSSKMVSISDCNFMGQGSLPVRWLKFILFKARLWNLANLWKTKGKGYTISKEDGLAYSYSVYQSLIELYLNWDSVRFFTLSGRDGTLIPEMSASQSLVVAQIKKNSSVPI